MQRGCCLGAAGAGFWGADARRLLRIEAPPSPPTAPRAGVEGVRRLTLGAERGRVAPVGLSGNLGGCVCGGRGRARGMPGCGRGWGFPPWGRDEAASGDLVCRES